MIRTVSQRSPSEAGQLQRRVPARGALVAQLFTVPLLLAVALACSPAGDEAATHAAPDDTAAAAEASAPTQPFEWPTGPRPVATLVVAGLGEIEIDLYPELAPATVENFEKLVGEGYYDGTSFHRVIPGFMVQVGDPLTRDSNPRNDGLGGPGYTIDDEFSAAPHARGIVSMANKGAPNTGGGQFFIVHADSPHLDGAYTAFGRMRSGGDVLDAIASVEIDKHGRFGPKDRPISPVVLERVTIRTPGS